MSFEKQIEHVKRVIGRKLSSDVLIKKIDFEGPKIIVYYKNLNGNFRITSSFLTELNKELKKRIIFRIDRENRKDELETKKYIKNLIGKKANISDIYFDQYIGTVNIESNNPELIIGKDKSNFKNIKNNTLWIPKIVRHAPLISTTSELIRNLFKEKQKEHKEILFNIGKRIYRPKLFSKLDVRLIFLGGFREIGRNCILIKTKESNILIDCGLNLLNGEIDFPHLETNEFSIKELDAVIISNGLLTHAGLTPILFKYGYDGPCYMSEPTRDISVMFQLKFIESCKNKEIILPYLKKDIKEYALHTITLPWNRSITITPDINLTLYNSGHILGSSFINFDFDYKTNLLITSNFNYQNTKVLDKSYVKFPYVDNLIMESVLGGIDDRVPNKKKNMKNFQQIINSTINANGKILIPASPIGNSQEIMVILDTLISNKLVPQLPIYVDEFIFEGTAIHTLYPEYLSNNLRNQIFFQKKNPFLSTNFIPIDSKKIQKDVLNNDSCIILASNELLTEGISSEYVKYLAENEENVLIFCSYQFSGTLGDLIQRGFEEFEFVNEDGITEVVSINLQIQNLKTFFGHTPRSHIPHFLNKIKPKYVIINNGEKNNCKALSNLINKKFSIPSKAPKNFESLKIY